MSLQNPYFCHNKIRISTIISKRHTAISFQVSGSALAPKNTNLKSGDRYIQHLEESSYSSISKDPFIPAPRRIHLFRHLEESICSSISKDPFVPAFRRIQLFRHFEESSGSSISKDPFILARHSKI